MKHGQLAKKRWRKVMRRRKRRQGMYIFKTMIEPFLNQSPIKFGWGK